MLPPPSGILYINNFRDDFLHGRTKLDITEASFSLKDYRQFLADNDDGIVTAKARQQSAFEAERARWEASGQISYGAELPEPQRHALALAYFGGYTQREIAQLTGVPLGTVKTRMFAAMRRLQGRLAIVANPAEGGTL